MLGGFDLSVEHRKRLEAKKKKWGSYNCLTTIYYQEALKLYRDFKGNSYSQCNKCQSVDLLKIIKSTLYFSATLYFACQSSRTQVYRAKITQIYIV